MFPSRGRTIFVLLLTALVLVTFDSRGSRAVDSARGVFGTVTRPFVVAGDVGTRPFRNLWAAATEVDELRAENADLRAQIDASSADLIAAENAIIQVNELKELIDLDSVAGIPKVTGDIIGDSPSNFEQRVELGIGSDNGVRVGMPVISGGLVGKVTRVKQQSCEVMLATDQEFFVRVKILSSPESGADTTTPSTTPSGIEVDGLDDAVAASTTTTTTIVPFGTETTSVPPGGSTPASGPDASVPGDSVPGDSVPGDSTPGSSPDGSTPESTLAGGSTLPEDSAETGSTTTTTTEPVFRETGSLHGNGADRLPSISFVYSSQQFGQIEVGDMVFTSGGSGSLAPPEIPVGRVVNIIDDNGVDGVQVEVELTANLDHLNFLAVLLYQPPTELGDG